MKKDLRSENVKKIAEVFPMCITEIRDKNGNLKKVIDFEKLKELLTGELRDREEAYEFTWAGKREALRKAFESNDKILRPVVEDSLNFFDTQNVYIEGDNLDILKILRRSYFEKVKMIYIDPPYNTGHDFIYKDDFKKSKEEYDEEQEVYDEEDNMLFKNKESNNGRFHSDWCSMIYSRLLLARDLLRPDGVIFISIDDNEVASLRKICDEVFGEDNFLIEFPRVTKRGGKSTSIFAKNHDYCIGYQKTNNCKMYPVKHDDENFKFEDEYVNERGKYKLNQTLDYDTLGYIFSLDYPITIDGETFYAGGVSEKEYLERKSERPQNGFRWRWSKELFDFGYKNGFVVVKKYDSYSRIYTKTYQNAKIEKTNNGYFIEYSDRTKPLSTLEFTENIYSNDNSKKNLTNIFEQSIFDYSKPISLINQLSSISTASSPPRLGRSRLNRHKKDFMTKKMESEEEKVTQVMAILSSISSQAPPQRHMLLCN